MQRRLEALLLVCLCAAPAAAFQDDAERNDWVIAAETVYTAAGEALSGGSVVVTGGKIAAVVPGASGDLEVAAVTPGMIDLSLRAVGLDSVEQSDEITPHVRAAAAVDLFAPIWQRQVESGVTAALVAPLDRNVIGGYGIVLKTAGPRTLAARTLLADAVMRGAMGTEPSRGNRSFGTPTMSGDFYQRRPTTRMGVEWAWRKASYDAVYARSDEAYAYTGSSDFLRALEGEIPLMIQAWTTQDIRTAVFLKEEIERAGLGRPRLILDAAAEAWREPQLLVRSGAAVVLPPLPSEGRTEDGALMTIGAAKKLVDLGVPVALSSHGFEELGQRLARQVGWAMRGGLTFDEALACVTSTPARLVGIDDQVGTIEVGKHADLVLWSGPPFEITSRVVGVLVDGKLVLDPRPEQGSE